MNVRRLCAAALSLAAVGCFATSCGARTELPSGASHDGACAALEVTAELAPLDVFVVMDSSGSMERETASGASKWSGVRDAFAAFVSDPDSSGIAVALTFFPIIDPSVPASCASDSECGADGACRPVTACFPSVMDVCITDAQCAAGEHCAVVGVCEDGSALCGLGDACSGTAGQCVWEVGSCDNQFTCDNAPYSTPVADLQALPGAAAAIVAAMDARALEGGTPTLPALAGAAERARAGALQAANHKRVLVLATDGIPSACDPALVPLDPTSGVPAVAAAASAAAADGIETFVIGVFSPDEKELAQKNLDAIAAAGGTATAFIISTGEPVTERFLDALRQIRTIRCAFDLPESVGLIDGLDAKVEVQPPSGPAVDVPRRASQAECDAGGFYIEERDGGHGRVVLCRSTCEVAQDRPVRISVTCKDS